MKKENNIYRWGVWGILVATFITVFFHRLSMGAVADDLNRDMGVTGAVLGNLTSMTFYAYALMQIPVGIMVDTIGVRKICTIGTALTALGSILFGLASTLTFAYISRFMIGIGTSVIIVSIMKVQSQWFDQKKFSTLSGLTSFFGTTGSLMATFPLTFLVISIGWRNTFFILGFVSAVLAVGIFLIVRDKPQEMKTVEIEKKDNNKRIIKAITAVVKNKYTWPNFLILASLMGSATAVLGLWGIPYIVHVYGITKQDASWYLSFLSYGFILGAPIFGKLSDVLNGEIKKILYVTTTLFTLIWVYILIIHGGKPPIEHFPIVFFLMGLCVISHILIFTNAKEVNDINFSGMASAIVNVGEFFGGSILSLFIGIVLDRGWSGKLIDEVKIYDVEDYRSAFILIIIAGFISIASAILMKDTKREKTEITL